MWLSGSFSVCPLGSLDSKVVNRADLYVFCEMRILIVCPYEWNRPGGVKTHITDSAKSLHKMGHQVVVVSSASGNPELPENWEHTETLPTFSKHIALFTLSGGKTIHFGGTQIDVTWMNCTDKDSIRCLMRKFSPDVVHFHTPWTPFLSIQLLQIATELRNDHVIQARFIATFHDTPAESGFGRFLGSFVMPIVSRYFMRAFDHVIAVSKPQSNYLSRFTNQKVHVIPNGIHIPKVLGISNNQSKWAEFEPFLLFLGRLEHRKGILDAIEVFRIVSNRFKHLNMIIAGDGPLRQHAKKLVNEYSLENVHFTGRVTENEKWDLMARAKLYLAPALYGESFGIVLLEAMSVGTPVVGYANDGYKSVTSGVFDSQFVQPGDFHNLAEIVSELIKEDDKISKLAPVSKQLAQKFDWDTLIHTLIPLYNKNNQ